MKELLEKLSSYNVFNYLFPGVLLAIIASNITPFKLMVTDNIYGVFVYYLYGLIVSRIGSLIVEPVFKKVKIVKFADYEDYVKASQADPLIVTLSEQNNMFRTLIAGVFMLCLLIGIGKFYVKYPGMKNYNNIILLTFSAVIFSWSYRKQTAYVRNRIASSTGSIPQS